MTTPQRAARHSRQVLEEVATQHVGYEINMLVETATLLSAPLQTRTRNAVLESFLIHARVLDEFLMSKSDDPDDVIATDYCPGWNQRRQSFLPRDTRDQASKRVAHLSATRGRDYRFPVAEMESAVRRAFKEFLRELAKVDPQARKWFADADREAARALPSVWTGAVTSTSG